MGLKFDFNEWLKTVDVWDDKYDYVMHNSHWLTSNWQPDCEKCRANGTKPESVTLTSSPTRNSVTLTDQNAATTTNKTEDQKYSQLMSPPPVPPPPHVELATPFTPIPPSHMSSKTFVTPRTGTKVNDTFTRATRQSTKKLLNQTQDLIDLNETFDLYKSALEETPVTETQPNMNDKRQLSKLPRFGFNKVS